MAPHLVAPSPFDVEMSIYNPFRVIGDLMHVVSRALLIRRIMKSNSSAGISLKTQILYAIVFVTRYADLFWNFKSMYNYVLKLYYLITTFWTIYLIAWKNRESYQEQLDRLPLLYVIIPAFVCGLIFARPWTPFEIFWHSSLFLEAFAMIPQFYLLTQSKNIDNFTADYVATLGGYRVFYLFNWIYKEIKGVRMGWVVWITGIVQTLLYAEFFYYWLKSKLMNEQIKLPQ